MIFRTGTIVPSAFETWVTETSFVRGESSASNSSRISSPRSLIGATLSTRPSSSRSICHGTMLEWCSMWVMRTSSPAFSPGRTKLWATRLMDSVAPRVKMISRASAAFRKRWTLTRAVSYARVATSLRWWTPRWMFEFWPS